MSNHPESTVGEIAHALLAVHDETSLRLAFTTLLKITHRTIEEGEL